MDRRRMRSSTTPRAISVCANNTAGGQQDSKRRLHQRPLHFPKPRLPPSPNLDHNMPRRPSHAHQALKSPNPAPLTTFSAPTLMALHAVLPVARMGSMSMT